MQTLGARLGLSIGSAGTETGSRRNGEAGVSLNGETSSSCEVELSSEAPDLAPTLPVAAQARLQDLLGVLGEMAQKLDAGEPLGDDAVADLETALTALADALGVDLSRETDVEVAVPAGDTDAGGEVVLEDAAPDDSSDDDETAPTAAASLLGIFDALRTSPLLAAAEKSLTQLFDQPAASQPGTGEASGNGASVAPASDAINKLLAALTDEAPATARRLAEVLEKLPQLEGRPAGTAAAPATGVQDAPASPEPAFDDLLQSVGRHTRHAESSQVDGPSAPAPDAVTAHRDAAVRETRDRPAVRPDLPTEPAGDPTTPGRHPDVPNAAASVSVATVSNGIEHVNARTAATGSYAPGTINLPHVAFEIVRHIGQGRTRFEIRLDPPELGRIDVKLDMDNSGTINARLTVERTETLDLLQRDQRALERALAQAGLDAGKTNLEFSLKQNPFSASTSGDDRRNPASPYHPARSIEPGQADEASTGQTTHYRGSFRAGGVNIYA